MTLITQHFILAYVGVVLCRTREPYRAIETLRQFAAAESMNGFYVWSILRGWEKYNLANPDDAPSSDNQNEPMGAIRWVGSDQAPTPGLFVVFYPHALLKNQLAYMQQIKEYAKTFPEGRKRLVLVTPPGFAPTVELEDDLTILDFDTPSYKEINDAFARTFASLSEAKRPKLKEDEKDRLMSAATGLTASEAETALARAFVEHRMKLPNVTVDDLSKVIMDVKIEAVRKTDILEVMPAESMSNVGGLENLKEWVAKRSGCFTEEARAFGIEPPKGILLAGPPGTGKSLSAKAIAHTMGLPLIKFDVSRVFAGLVGESEARVRNALKMIEAMAPCVVLLDEIDEVDSSLVNSKRIRGKL